MDIESPRTMRHMTATDGISTVVSHESEQGRWEMAHCVPDAALRRYVLGYQGYIESATSFSSRRELPSDRVILAINLGSTVRITDPRTPNESSEYHGSFIAGPWDTYAITELSRGWRGIQVNFTPRGAYRILGLPMDSFTNRVVDFEEAVGVFATDLVGRLSDATTWIERFAILDTALLGRVVNGRDASQGVTWAWDKLHRTGGQIPIGSLAAELGCSRKHLIAQFRREIGLPPKLLARIIRFNRTLRLLDVPHGERESWSRIALSAGYSDQAHLIKEFRQFAGGPPSDLMRRRLPDGGGVMGD